MKKKEEHDISGILVVNKDRNMTSHDVVDRVRRHFKIKKAGHAGTLDPSATGVLVLLIGRATKLSNRFLEEDKEYLATMKLGESTSTGDSDGEVERSVPVDVSREKLEEVFKRFRGEIEQTPPMYSAKKVNGKRLYALARKGISVKRDPVKIEIKQLEIVSVDLPFVVFRTLCSKGTYVRQLASDIGDELGCGAHLTELERTGSGKFSLNDAISLGELFSKAEDELDGCLLRI